MHNGVICININAKCRNSLCPEIDAECCNLAQASNPAKRSARQTAARVPPPSFLMARAMRKATRKAMRKGGKKAKAMKGMKRRAMRKKKAAAPEEAPMKAMRRK